MPKVYSYIRFSTPEQKKGTSIERQKEAGQRWIDENNVGKKEHERYVLDKTLKIDEGTSAFSGKNLKESNPLGGFIAKVKAGKIPEGSLLIIENTDRFSRLPPRKVYGLFCEVVENGCNIHVLSSGQTITMDNIDNPEIVFTIIGSMVNANQESVKKSVRLAAAHAKRRQRIRERAKEGKYPAEKGLCPGWVRWSKTERKYVEKPEAVEAIRHVFTRSKEGAGYHVILRELNARWKALGYSKVWTLRYVQGLLKGRAVLGEYQPHKFVGDRDTGKKKRIKDGAPIKDYYPQVVDEEEYYAAKAAAEKRSGRLGRRVEHPEFLNVLGGLVKMVDGRRGYIVASHQPNGTHRRRFVSEGYMKGVEGSCAIGIDYGLVEQAVFSLLRDLDTSDLAPSANVSGKEMDKRKRTLAGMNEELEKLRKTMGDYAKTPAYAALADSWNDLQGKRDALEREIETLSVQDATMKANPLGEFKTAVEYIASIKSKKKQMELRFRLKTLVAMMVSEIILDPRRPARRCTADVTIKLLNGETRKRFDIATPMPIEVLEPIDDKGGYGSLKVGPDSQGGFTAVQRGKGKPATPPQSSGKKRTPRKPR